MSLYYRPIVECDGCRPKGALSLAGGALWFDRVEVLSRQGSNGLIEAQAIPSEIADRLCAQRGDVAGLSMDHPRIMAVLNATPDSFSDGGDHAGFEAARKAGARLVSEGADILDIGGESTRPGADLIPDAEEVARVLPLVTEFSDQVAVSIDTRKASVAGAAIDQGARLFNDVSALSFDADSMGIAADSGVWVCLMHSSGDPKTMQKHAVYDNVLLDVYDYLAARIEAAIGAGIARSRIVIDPGIGFGKTQAHNLTLIKGLSLFHALGCPILLGVSRKRFIGTIGNAPEPKDRAPGSIAIGLEGLRQGVQILRVHDMSATKQAVALWQASRPEQ